MLTILLALIGSALGTYLTGYLTEKGKGLATKEDIGRVTTIVEEIKAQHAAELENLKSENQLKMAALDKRLQAHQEAFALWRRIYQAVHTDEIGAVVSQCQAWWDSNCLYLSQDARQAFSDAYWYAGLHKGYMNVPVRDAQASELVIQNWAKIEAAGQIILNAVALPGLTPPSVVN
jgi:predicted acyl esterase